MTSINPTTSLQAIQESTIENSASARILSHAETFTGISKSWNWLGKKVDLIHDINLGLQAFVTEGNRVTEVGKDWIRGIPSEVKHNPSILSKFLEDTYVRIGTSMKGEYSIEIKGRLRGGVKEGRRLKRNLVAKISEAIEHAKKAKDKDLTALIGFTGR